MVPSTTKCGRAGLRCAPSCKPSVRSWLAIASSCGSLSRATDSRIRAHRNNSLTRVGPGAKMNAAAFSGHWETVWRTLNQSEKLPPSLSDDPALYVRPRLRLWDDAFAVGSSTEPATLTVFEVPMANGGRRFILREGIWRRNRDLAAMFREIERYGQFSLVEPTLEVRDAEIRIEDLRSLMQEGAALHLPVVFLGAWNSVSSSGRAVGYEFYSADSPPAVLRLQWSFETPEAWAPFLDWFARLRQLLESWLPKNAANP
jgi:hypothetical protein